MVFYDLVLHNAHTRFLGRELCKGYPLAVSGSGSRKEYAVHLILGICREYPLCFANAAKRPPERLNVVNRFVIRDSVHLFCPLRIIFLIMKPFVKML